MLKTKLNKPGQSTKLIFRKELIDKLESGNEKKLTLVSAPAGYGKSTLISQWIDQFQLAYSWYSLDRSDNDLVTFLKYTIAGIQSSFPDHSSEAMQLLQSNSNPSYETIAGYIINDFFEINERFTIVYDDYHLIENKEINDLIYFLTGNLPDNVQLVLITRSDPSIPFSRLRSQQMITDIRLADLCFNAQDIFDFFKKSLQINLSREDAANLEHKTEGWIAGLQLTGLFLQGKEDVSNFVKKLKGDNRYIMDYLLEEVLEQQTQGIREFLLFTSILNRFNAPLCNSMLGIANSQDIIEDLERNNMFIIPLDDERNWFRYHHLFSSLLQQRLSIKYREKIPELHMSASQWFEKHNQLVFALDHSLAAGDKNKALSHFANVIQDLWAASQYQTILQYGRKFSHEELIDNVELCFNYYWILFQSGLMEEAIGLIQLLKSKTTDKTDLAKIQVCINFLQVFSGNLESIIDYSELKTEDISKDTVYWNILGFLATGEAQLLRFELNKSFQSFDRAAKNASVPQFFYFKMVNRTRASFVLTTMGEYTRAYQAAKDLLDDFENNPVAIDLLSSIPYCMAGNFLIKINQVEEGLQKCTHGFEISKKTTNPVFIATCTLLMAEAYYLAGEYAKAITYVEELDEMPYAKATKFLVVISHSMKSKLYHLTNNKEKLVPLLQKEVREDKNHAFEYIYFRIENARHQFYQGEINLAIKNLIEIADILKKDGALGILNEVELLLAKAYFELQDLTNAFESLSNAILRTQKVGLIRMYIIEGEKMEILLKELKTEKRNNYNEKLKAVDTNYINKILRVFEKEKTQPVVFASDSLSSRELDTLKLLAENLSNQEIANALYISITTVKTHVRNILIKLEAKNRHEAVNLAKNKGVLSF